MITLSDLGGLADVVRVLIEKPDAALATIEVKFPAWQSYPHQGSEMIAIGVAGLYL